MLEPIIWDRTENYLISDIKPHFYDKAKTFMLKNYIGSSPLHDVIKYQEDESFPTEYFRLLDHILLDQCSLVIIDDDTDRIIGVAMMKMMTIEMKSWIQIRLVSDSPKLNLLLDLYRKMITDYRQQNANSADAIVDSMHLFELCVLAEEDSSVSSDNWIPRLFHSTIDVARNMKMSSVTFIALTAVEQKQAEAAGFQKLLCILYSTYKVDNTHPFLVMTYSGELGAVLYGQRVEPIVPWYDM